MRPTNVRCTRLASTALAMGGLAIASVVVPNAPMTARAQAETTVTIGPGANLKAALEKLNPGDTLLLAPGVYRTGSVTPTPSTFPGPKIDAKGTVKKMSAGTASRPITVEAADMSSRPLILGELKLWGANYWQLDGLRVQAVTPLADALLIGGGRGWTVRNSEFSGARRTGAYSNVTITTDKYGTGAPQQFAFSQNCVHDAGQNPKHPGQDHNIYVSFAGNAASGGEISRNVIFNHPNGVGIKLGNGGLARARGPWNVKVTYNTIAQGGRQVFLHADVRNNLIARNILADSTAPFHAVKTTAAVYLHDIVGGGNTFLNNYATASTMFSFGTNARIGVDNAVHANPRFAGAGCNGYRATAPGSTAYGRYGVGAVPTR